MFSGRIVVGFPEQRLAYLSEKIAAARAEYCVVLEPKSLRYLGLFRIPEAVSCSSEHGILVDLIAGEKFVPVMADTSLHVL